MKFLRFSFQFKKVVMFLFDGVLVYCSILTGVYLRLGTLKYEGIIPKSILVTSICLISLYYAELYAPKIIKNIQELLISLLQALGVAYIVLAGIYYLYPPVAIGRGISLVATVLILILIVSWRLLYRLFLMSSGMEENILVIGTNPIAEALANEISENRSLGYNLVGFIDRHPGRVMGNPIPFPVLGDFNDIRKVVDEHSVNRIVVALDERRGRLPMESLVECKLAGLEIDEGVAFYEGITGKILIDKLRPSWLIFSSGFEHSKLTRLSKRIFELIVSVSALLLLFPLIFVIAVLIKAESRGSIFFKQERIGENSKFFTLYKFRSMREDAEKETGPVWAGFRDDRVTKVGSFLRTSRLDELPQIFNVFRGDMSIVGPRPERPYFVEQLSKQVPYYTKRHSVKPGITGWAQVRYMYGSSVEDAKEKLQYDLYYIKNMSLFLDLSVILDTIKVIYLGKGSR